MKTIFQNTLPNATISVTTITHNSYLKNQSLLQLFYGVITTPFGKALVVSTEREICTFAFINKSLDENFLEIQQIWEQSTLIFNNEIINRLAKPIFEHSENKKIALLLKGTSYQLSVWQALLTIPFGTTASYSAISKIMNQESATRAVASAVGKNRIGYIIPCHRVIQKNGAIGEFYWGRNLKKEMLQWEKDQLHRH